MLHIRKTAYLAAYLLSKSPSKSLDRLKLMKLMYLADRLSLEKTGLSISLDKYVSMDNGPVLSETYNIIKDAADKSPDTPQIWNALIATNGLICSLKADSTEPIRMSEFTESVADQIWHEHGRKSSSELVELTHELPEWRDPSGSSEPIQVKSILLACGFSAEDAQHYADEHERFRLSLSHFKAS